MKNTSCTQRNEKQQINSFISESSILETKIFLTKFNFCQAADAAFCLSNIDAGAVLIRL
ncbi:hypothetical protein [Adhaeribacter arboris]|uniref:hypothetical protein n=1 Tax=Adhaeribacter arboris TaxID=2072846 RepID=UPI001304DA8E|nr:hypothetical protein [Adhaeribacter arboris]